VATLNTLADSVHVQSRFFAPAVGVPEDPVTGSVHGPLAVYLVVNELIPMLRGTAAISCVQAEAGGRAGLVRAMVTQNPGEGYAVRIAGQCVTTMRGRLLA
jgi:PhzF family phenazine biosynthesis protein